MTDRVLLKIKRPPTTVTDSYDSSTNRNVGEVFGTGCWRLRVSTGKHRHDQDARLFGVQIKWGAYRRWLREQGWWSLTIIIGWPRRVRRIGFTWSDSAPPGTRFR